MAAWRIWLVAVSAGGVIAASACSASNEEEENPSGRGPATSVGGGTASASGGGGSTGTGIGIGGGTTCERSCSTDLQAVVDCNGAVVEECEGLEGCDFSLGTCGNACEAAVNNRSSVGCDYYATDIEAGAGAASLSYCYAAIVANTWDEPVHLTVSRGGSVLPVESFARIPQGQGPSLTYANLDNTAGLPPGEVAILFLSGNQGASPNCPAPPAVSGDAGVVGTGQGQSFRIETDVPAVVYQINPFGGGSVAVTGASLLLPTSVWDTNYIGVFTDEESISGGSMNIIAASDDTEVTILPVEDIAGGGGLPAGAANTPYVFNLDAGQQAQFSQAVELTGSVISSDKPIGLMGGQRCMQAPNGVAYCDHGEQMIPPVRALGHEYVGVMHKPRAGEPALWRIVGAVDGTELTYSTPVGGPATIDQGQASAFFVTGEPFVVRSQDADHPFMLFTYMASSQWDQLSDNSGLGDPDFVISVPPDQYLNRYVFFTDPTYPETHVVVVRAADPQGNFRDVNLDCAGVIGGWAPVGNDFEWTRVDLMTGNFQDVGNCSTGRHEISSDGRFGLWVWGWGTPDTTPNTQNVSYGYPGGMNVQPINDVIIPPTPK